MGDERARTLGEKYGKERFDCQQTESGRFEVGPTRDGVLVATYGTGDTRDEALEHAEALLKMFYEKKRGIVTDIDKAESELAQVLFNIGRRECQRLAVVDELAEMYAQAKVLNEKVVALRAEAARTAEGGKS